MTDLHKRMASKIEMWPTERLRPYDKNPRTHSPQQVDQIAASILEFGFNNPVLVDSNQGIIAGHGRLLAAQKLGLEQVPVVVLDHLTDAQRRAYIIADNKLALNAGWDEELLAAELAALGDENFDIGLVGFSDQELADLLDGWGVTEGLTEQDEVPEPPETPVSRPGDLWLLGQHRLVCGDSGDAETLGRLMGRRRAVLYATDPPYGVAYDGTNHPPNKNRDWGGDYEDLDAWDHFADQEAFERFLQAVFQTAMLHVTENAAWYCWHATATAQSFRRVWDTIGVRYHQTIVWVKPTHVLGFSMWNYRMEPCLMGWRQGHKPAAFQIADEMSNVWQVDWEGKARCTDGMHPTQKPVRLFELPMLKHTRSGDVCLETFCGSGSQIIAGERLGRCCYAAEKNPRFIDVAVHRWQNYTGQPAMLDGDGRSFAEVETERLS
jgi:DNA modification methylase